jgi:hypothetical protein
MLKKPTVMNNKMASIPQSLHPQGLLLECHLHIHHPLLCDCTVSGVVIGHTPFTCCNLQISVANFLKRPNNFSGTLLNSFLFPAFWMNADGKTHPNHFGAPR